MKSSCLKAIVLSCLALATTGCFRHTYRVQQQVTLKDVKTAPLDELIKQVQTRFDAVKTLNASVEITASTGGAKKGKITEYTAFGGYMLLRKPEDLRVLLLLPVVHTLALDMITDGKTFKMLIPPKSQAITGTNAEPVERNSNPIYNLRPKDFYDSLLVRGVAQNELVAMISGERLYQPDPKKKQMISEPDYDLSLYVPKDGGVELSTHRVIHIGRATLLPYAQDIYGTDGRVVTRATYEEYGKEDGIDLPHHIIMERPLDELKIDIRLTKVATNQQMEDDQFDLKIPKGTKVQELP